MVERFTPASRKTIPQADEGSRLHENGTNPSTRVETARFNIGQTVISRGLPWNQLDIAQPLIPLRTVRRRTIGGGTSKKALSSAKQDIRKR